MGFKNWLNRSYSRIKRDGWKGVEYSLWDFKRGINNKIYRNLSPIYWFFPDTRTININGELIKISQESIHEFDHMISFMNESRIIRDFHAQIGSNDIVWDVGSNFGTYAVIAGKNADSVYAFEPNPNNHKQINKNKKLNEINNIEIKEYALSKKDGEQKFHLDPRYDGRGGRGSLHSSWKEDTKDITVECITGDSLVESGEVPPPDILKIDVEGAELSVLDGLEKVLTEYHCRVVYCEIHRVDGKTIEDQFEDVKARLERYGFVHDPVQGVTRRFTRHPDK